MLNLLEILHPSQECASCRLGIRYLAGVEVLKCNVTECLFEGSSESELLIVKNLLHDFLGGFLEVFNKGREVDGGVRLLECRAVVGGRFLSAIIAHLININ